MQCSGHRRRRCRVEFSASSIAVYWSSSSSSLSDRIVGLVVVAVVVVVVRYNSRFGRRRRRCRRSSRRRCQVEFSMWSSLSSSSSSVPSAVVFLADVVQGPMLHSSLPSWTHMWAAQSPIPLPLHQSIIASVRPDKVDDFYENC